MSDADVTAAARKKKLTGRLIWGFLILSVTATVTWRLACAGDPTSAGKVQWRCVPEPPRDVVCVFESDADARGMCFDLVLACDGDVEHRAEVCSGPLTRGGRTEVEVGEMTPPLPDEPICGKPRYERQRDL